MNINSNIYRTIFICIICAGLIFHQSCTTSRLEKFNSKIEQFGTDGTISSDEWKKLVEIINRNLDDIAFAKFVTGNEVDQRKIEDYLNKKGYTIESEHSVPMTKAINIYIENSGSMFGFVNGNTGFKNTLTKLIVDLKSNGYPEEYINFHFINQKITPITISGKLEDYPISLSGATLKDNDSNDSNINEIYKQILENTSDSVMSILLSDCVYSVHKDIVNNDVEGALKIWETKTVGVFNDILKNKNLATLLVQLTSDFTGNYYTKDNQPISLNKDLVPYYITVIGNENELQKFDFVNRLDGFQNKFVFTTQDYSNNAFYSVLNSKEDNGTYKQSRNQEKKSNPNVIHSIEGIRVRGNNDPFTFSLAINLHKIPVDNEYIIEKKNYIVEKGDYQVLSILPFDKNLLSPNELNKLEKANTYPSHLIIIQSTSNIFNELKLSLKKNTPKWIYQWSTNDDTNITDIPTHTFGLKYLAEGISEAYKNNSKNENYITFTINIKQ